jgi:hypothetical protein
MPRRPAGLFISLFVPLRAISYMKPTKTPTPSQSRQPRKTPKPSRSNSRTATPPPADDSDSAAAAVSSSPETGQSLGDFESKSNLPSPEKTEEQQKKRD